MKPLGVGLFQFLPGINRIYMYLPDITRGKFKHGIDHNGLANGPESPGTQFVFNGFFHDIVKCILIEGECDTIHLKQTLILFYDGIPGFGEDISQCLLVQGIQVRKHRDSSDDLGYEPECFQILGRHILQQVAPVNLVGILHGCVSHCFGIQPLSYLFFNPVKCATTDKKDILCIDRDHFLIGMLSSPLRWNIYDGSLEQLKEALLYSFPGNITGNGRIVALARYLVNLIDENNPLFSCLDIVISNLQEPGKYAFNVLAYVAGFGKYRGIYDGEGNMQHFGDGSCQECFACTGLSYQDNIGFLNFNLVRFLALDMYKPFVVVINSDRDIFLCIVLSDYILVQEFLDLGRFGELDLVDIKLTFLFQFLLEYSVRLLYAGVTDVSRYPCNKQVGITFFPSTKRTPVHFDELLLLFIILSLGQHLIYHSIIKCFLGCHPVITIGILFDLFD